MKRYFSLSFFLLPSLFGCLCFVMPASTMTTPTGNKRRNNASNDVENDFNSSNVSAVVDGGLRIDLVKDKSIEKTSSNDVDQQIAKPRRSVKLKDPSNSLVPDAEEYVPKWSSSLNQASALDNGDESSTGGIDDDASRDSNQLLSVDDLPPFSDEESKALHREIKLLEKRRDEAAKSARSHKERVGVITDHLHSVRQEIEHTNSLFAAKNDEVDTEEHLSSLSQREFGQYKRDTSSVDESIVAKKNKITRCQSQLISAEEELEKLRTDLNWNQEELEQWATAATKKEEENLILQKYASADDLKIKELTLTVEDLTKISVEKKSLLENELTETRSNQTELEKLAERFKSRHDERRQLIQQWKDAIESMNNRDQAIGALASQYADVAKQEDEVKDVLVRNRNQHETLEVRMAHRI